MVVSMSWGTIKPVGLYFTLLFLASTSLAQETLEPPPTQTLKDKIKNKLQNQENQNGSFGIFLGSKVNDYTSTPSQIQIKAYDVEKAQKSLYDLKCATQGLDLKVPNLTLNSPQLSRFIPQISINQVEQIIDKRALETAFRTQLSQFAHLEKEWQPHLNDMQTIIHNNFGSLVDIPQISQQLLTYIQDNHLLDQLAQDASQLSQIDWSHFQINDFIHEDRLQSLLNNLSSQFNVTQLYADQFLDQSQVALNNQLHQSMTQTLSTLYQTGFTVKDNTVYFTNPNNQNDRFSLRGDFSASNFTCTLTPGANPSGNFSANAGNYLTVNGNFSINSAQTGAAMEESLRTSFNQILGLLNQAMNGEMSLNELLSKMQTLIKDVPTEQFSNLMQAIEGNMDSDFNVSLNLQALSDSFQGSGNYQFIDIILEALGHDIGTITLNKKQFKDISNIMAANRDPAEVGKYIFENVAGYSVDKIGYNIVRDVTNTYLTEHFTGITLPIQQSLFNGGGLAQIGNSYFAAARLKQWSGGSLVATGSYNQRSINNTPLLKKDGYLHLRTELQSNSLGIVYLPKIVTFPETKTRIDGLVHLEALFVRAKSASVLSKTDLVSENVVALYNIPLSEIPEATKTYTLPMLSAGVNVQQRIGKGVCVNWSMTCFPGLKQTGNINEMTDAITLRYLSNVSVIFDLNGSQKKKAPTNFGQGYRSKF